MTEEHRTAHNTWKLRSMYLLYFASLGSLMPYLPLLFASRGFSPIVIGLLLSVNPLVGAILPPLWGRLADRTGVTIPWLRIQFVALPILVFLLYRTNAIGFAVALLVLISLFLTGAIPLCDHLTLEFAQRDKIDYARVRVFGSLGFSAANLSISLFLRYHAINSLYLFYVPFVTMTFMVSWLIRDPSARDQAPMRASQDSAQLASPPSGAGQRDAARPGSTSPGDGAVENAAQPSTPRARLVLFFCGIFALSLTMPVFYSFFPLYIHDLHFPTSIIPIAYTLSSGSELLTMPFASRVFAKIGARGMLVASGLAYAVRWIVVGLAPSDFAVIGIQVVHGIAFGFFYTATVMYLRQAVPPKWRATAQGAFAGTTALGNVVGNTAGGALYSLLTPHVFFFMEAGIALFAALFFTVVRLRPRKTPTRLAH